MKQWKYPVNPAILPLFLIFVKTQYPEFWQLKIQNKLHQISWFIFAIVSTLGILDELRDIHTNPDHQPSFSLFMAFSNFVPVGRLFGRSSTTRWKQLGDRYTWVSLFLTTIHPKKLIWFSIKKKNSISLLSLNIDQTQWDSVFDQWPVINSRIDRWMTIVVDHQLTKTLRTNESWSSIHYLT